MTLKRDPLKPDQISSVIASGVRAKLSAGRSLYLMVKRKGRAYWVCQYRDPGDGKVRSKGLGSAAKITMAAARRSRDAWMGIDPSERCDKHHRRKAPRAPAGATFGDAHAAYQANHAGAWKPRQRVLVARLFANHAGPLDAMPIAAITAEQIADLLRPRWRGPSAGSGQAARLRALMERVFKAAEIEPNPARRALALLPSKTKTVRHHPGMAAVEVPGFMRELAADDSAVSRCLQFVILCGVRTSEATGATWGEINLGAMLWEIPGDRMKAGEPHDVPLSGAAAALLRRDGNGFVFPVSSTIDGRLGASSLNKYLKKRRHGITVHGSRATLASWAQDERFAVDVIDAVLAHKEPNRTRRPYFRSVLLKERRKLLEQWAEFCKG